MNLEELRREHAEAGIGDGIATLLERIVKATAPTYPAREYLESGSWSDEALSDALHDWVEVRLLRRGDLSAMLLSAASERSFRAALTTSFGQFLVNRRRRTSATNLFKRTANLLVSSKEFILRTGRPPASSTTWTLATDPADAASNMSLSGLVSLAWGMSDADLEVIRYGPYSLKSSPILRQPSLLRFLTHLLSGAEGTVSLAQIAEVMRLRFNLAEPGLSQLDERLAAPDAPVASRIEIEEIAGSVRARLGQPAADAILAFSKADGNFRKAGEVLGLSPRSVQESVSVAMSMIAEYAESLEEARLAYARLVESLF
jgi:hypothetical protein